jgi:hypothetical protein
VGVWEPIDAATHVQLKCLKEDPARNADVEMIEENPKNQKGDGSKNEGCH